MTTEPLREMVPDQVWEVRHSLRMLPGVYLPARMVVLRLDEDTLALWSPVPMSEGLAAAIEALGQVSLILAPNNYHHLFLVAAMERFPKAEVWVAPAVPTKQPALAGVNLLGPASSPPWAPSLSPFFLDGAPAMEETAFIHRSTRTLLLTDSLFNLQSVDGLLSAAVFRLMGSSGHARQSKLWRSTVKDTAAMGESFARLLNEDFDRIVMAHGEVVEANGRAVLREAAGWLPGVS